MKSFKEILREQEGRKEFKELLKSGQIDIKIEKQPSSQPSQPSKPSYQGKGARRAAKVNASQQTPSASRVADAALTPRQQQAQVKGYRTPEGNITQRGVETYATRRGAMGYGDPGKDPSKYGVDPRQAAEAARERTRTASQGVGAERRAARRGIKIDVAKIERNYPAPKPPTGSQSSFSQFSRQASSISSDVKTGRANIPTPEMSAKDTKFFKGLEPDPVKRTAAKIDAAIGQQADDLMGRSGPQAPTGYRQQGLKDLSRAIDDLDTPSSKPQVKPTQPAPAPKVRRGQGSRAAGSTVVRGGAPQLPDVPKPTGAARVTYGQGKAPTSFRDFSRSVEGKPPVGPTPAEAQALKQIDTARETSTAAGRLNRQLGGIGTRTTSIAKGAVKRGAVPVAMAALDAYSDITDPNIKASPQRAVTKQATSGLAAWKAGVTAARLTPGPPLVKAGAGLVVGTATQLGGQALFDKIAGQTPTQKATAAKAYRQSQELQKGEWADKPGMGFDTRPLQTVIKDPKTGQETVGYLTKQTIPDTPTSLGGVATGYKPANTSNAARAASTSNWLERIGRTINPGAYEKSDAEDMKRRVAKIKQLQGLPEGRTPMKTYTQFVEQVRNTYQQSDTSKKTEKGTQTFLRASDYVADLAARSIGRATDYAGSALSGFVKGVTGGAVDLERIGHEGENLINRAGRGLRDTEKKMGRNLSQTNIQLNPPGSGYPSNLRRGR